ncbi:hypothetical protein DW228_18490 [Bacteroides fragilis]|uniref:Uncharacterized protein n=1 Tax=Bacteroides fragilis TaxID=817 RepID=A0A396BSM0_BACFG|nr:hypothetical protein DW228_18490 [Bacteroides fragilis]
MGCQSRNEVWHYDYVPNLDCELVTGRLYEGPWIDKPVHPKDIVGLSYGYAYEGKVWVEHLKNLKRPSGIIHLNHSLEDLKGFIDKSLPKNSSDRIMLRQIGIKFIVTNGQHRACIAKFINYPIKSATVTPIVSGLAEDELMNFIRLKTEEAQSKIFRFL